MLQNEALRVFLYFLNAILYLASIGLWLVMPEEKSINFAITISSLGLTSLLLFESRDQIKKINSTRKIRRTSYALINLFLVMVIIAFLNYLSFKHGAQFDFSNGKMNSLTDQSIQVMKGLKKDLEVKIFARKDEASGITSIMDLYKYQKENMKTEVIDPDLNPDKLNEYQIDKVPTVVMEYDKKRELIQENSELAYTNAMIKLSRDKRPMLVYLDGMGGPDLLNKEKEGASIFHEVMTKSLFDLKIINVLELQDFPADTKTVMLWGPKREVPQNVLEKLYAFHQKGGRVIVAIDPGVSQDNLPQTREYIKNNWFINVDNNLVVDQEHHVAGSKGTVPLIKTFNTSHPLTKSFVDPVFFPLGQAIFGDDTNKIEGARWTDLTYTTEGHASWADMTPIELISGKLIFNSDEDKEGPVSLAGVLEIVPTKEGEPVKKMLVVGNSSLIQNSYASLGGNYRFILKSLSWLSEDDLIESFNLPIDLPAEIVLSNSQYKTVFYGAVVAVPLLFLIIALMVSRKRRKA